METTTDRTDRATPEEKDNRVDEVLHLMAKGLTTQAQIVRYLARETEWGKRLSERQLRNYCQLAREALRDELTHIDRTTEAATVLRQIRFIVSEALRLSDLKTALSALDRLIKMLHLDDPSHELDWKAAFVQAGLDPDAAYSEFISIMTMKQVDSHVETDEND